MSKEWICDCDIEIVFPGISFNVLTQFMNKISMTGYHVEDKSDRGWGCVILREQCWNGDRRKLGDLIVEFISHLKPLIQDVVPYINAPPTVRLGIYYTTYTLTLSLDRKSVECLNDIAANLEISSYPSET